MADLRKYANNFTTTLNGSITDVATSITLTSASGLPAIGANEYLVFTADDGAGNIEVMHATDDASSPTFTVSRGEEGTSGYAFSDGASVEVRVTTESFTDVLSADTNPTLRGTLKRTVTAGITASTTQTQGQGALTSDINEISTCANDDDTVTLPTAVTGMFVSVVNNGANRLQVFPASSDDLGNGADTATTISAGGRKSFFCYDATNWVPVVTGGSGTFQADQIIAGDPGLENTGITVNGSTYESVLKASDIGGSNVAMAILHRHSTTLAPILVGARSNSDTSSHAAVTDGQALLSLYAVGHDGTDYVIAGQIDFEVDGSPGSNDMPGRIVFKVTPDGGTTAVEAFRVSSDKDFLLSGHLEKKVTAGITASTTQTQGQGALTSDINEISTCANSNDTVTLPTAAAGRSIYIINNGAETLQIFPASSDNLGEGADTATTLASGGIVGFTAYDATNWKKIETGGGGGGTPGRVLLDTKTASASASLDFTSVIDGTYDTYIFEVDDLLTQVGSTLYMRTSTNNGSSWDNTSTNYQESGQRIGVSGTPVGFGSSTQTGIRITSDLAVEANSNDAINSTITLKAPSNAAKDTMCYWQGIQNHSTGVMCITGCGARVAAADVDAVQFIMASGTITSGSIRLYGIVAS
jgi:hypothetical protein